MIPPLQDIRLRSIGRWLKDNPTTPPLTTELQSSRTAELDALMMEEFEAREDRLKDQMMRAETWGTEQGIVEFNTSRMEIWQEVVSEQLPTTAQQLES